MGARRSCGGGYTQGQLSLVGGREHDGTRARVGRALSDIARSRRGLVERERTERDVAAESRYPRRSRVGLRRGRGDQAACAAIANLAAAALGSPAPLARTNAAPGPVPTSWVGRGSAAVGHGCAGGLG
jgi:hypothetical protein